MSHWNYRIFSTLYEGFCGEFEGYSTVREVYYDDNGVITAMSAEAQAPSGQSPDDLKEDLNKMLFAFLKPVLTPKDIPGYVYDRMEIPEERT